MARKRAEHHDDEPHKTARRSRQHHEDEHHEDEHKDEGPKAKVKAALSGAVASCKWCGYSPAAKAGELCPRCRTLMM